MTRPEGSPAPRDRAATERAIVEAAARLLSEHGFSALNVQAVAAAASVDRKLVYRYFGGIEGIVERLGADVTWTLGEAADAVPAATYGQAAAELVLAYGRALTGDPLLRGLVAWETVEDAPALRALEVARSGAMRAWTAERLADIDRPDGRDVAAINAVLIAGVQMLALRRARARPFAGLPLDEPGWARIEAAVTAIAARVYAA